MSVLWSPRFPTPELVDAAAALLPRLPAWDGREGPRSRLIVAPGVLQVSQRDPAKVERAAETALKRRRAAAKLEAVTLLLPDLLAEAEHAESAVLTLVEAGVCSWADLEGCSDLVQLFTEELARCADDARAELRAKITSWSRKSRANMVKVLGQLDYAPLFASGRLPAMLTLTYPGDWLTVAPNARACKAHVDAFKKRFERHYGVKLIGVWKREFQRRGAPHYHILMTPPEPVNGETFQAWVSRTWADVVAHPDDQERANHRLAGTGVDYAEGMRAQDPTRLAVYFSKHGAFSAKDYQNDAPAEWVETGSVGRFWGVWGLSKALRVVETPRDVADAAARTMRRWARANGYRVEREVWRKKYAERVDTSTGELVESWRWVKRKSGSRVRRMPGRLGFLMLNDAPAFTSQLSRYLDQVAGPSDQSP